MTYRVKMSALWVSILFIFAYIDLFQPLPTRFPGWHRGRKIAGFTINQAFLLGTTVYIVIPSLMVFLALVLRPRVSRIANVVLTFLYALTIIVGAIGEWNYWILGSALEVALLGAIVYYAWTWLKERSPSSRGG